MAKQKNISREFHLDIELFHNKKIPIPWPGGRWEKVNAARLKNQISVGINISGTKHSRVDQVKFVEDSL